MVIKELGHRKGVSFHDTACFDNTPPLNDKVPPPDIDHSTRTELF